MTDKPVSFSVLDLAPIPQGSSAKEAFSHSLDLAQLAEKRGYHRYWLAEHHNMVGIASAATSVLIGYLAANTTTLHLGSGGVMLPNHSPLVIAEQFGTLNTLYPGRIDLGLGRAPGSDQPTMRALLFQQIGCGRIVHWRQTSRRLSRVLPFSVKLRMVGVSLV